jgi:acetyltransferase-like isoleucine patch superfamily enzyme
MNAPKTVSSKQELKALFQRHGLILEGTLAGTVSWEEPVKIFRSAHVADVEIGAYSYVSPKTEIRSTEIGRYCSIGDNVNIRGSAHPKDWLSSHPFSYENIFSDFVPYEPPFKFARFPKKTRIGHDVWIGTEAIVLPGVRIGNGAVIGAGAVVSKDVPDYAVAVGNPARVVKYRFDEKTVERLTQAAWWDLDWPKALSQNLAAPLDDPSRMLEFMAEKADAVPQLPGIRKIYSTAGNKITIQTVRPDER